MTSAGEDGAWAGLEPEHARRLQDLLAAELPEVFRANRIIEQQTRYVSEAGRNNLVDALSHIGTLAERGSELNSRQQAAQVAKIEEHLRRAMMEAPEEVVRARLADIAKRWDEYQREAAPYRRAGTLRGVPRHSELEGLRERIDQLMEEARSKKRDETSWEEWRAAAAHMTEAADLSKELADELEQCIGEALRMTRDRQRERKSNRQWLIGILIAIALTVGSYLLGQATTPDTETPQRTQPAPRSR